jgi:hypothetical protein
VPAKGDFPTRANCDPTDPEEAFLWMFAALPHVRGAPLLMPIDYYRQVSKRLWDLGCRPVEEPILEWVAPSATEPHWLTSPGRWVPAGSGPKRTEEDEAREAMTKMSRQQKAELLGVLEALAAGEVLPDTPAGKVVNTLSFEQREVVLKVLRQEARGD